MTVRVEREGPVATVVLARPRARNAVDRETAEALVKAFTEFEESDAAVAVLWGEGGTFCAGADLKAMDNRVAEEGNGPMGPTRMRLSKPVIAAVAGHAVAGGLELALWCDLRVAEEDAVFGVFCRRWGVPLIDGGTVRLPRLIGVSRAMDLILTGRPVPAREAYDMGLVNRVVPAGRARAAAEELARELAALPQTCLREDRLSLLEQEGVPEPEAMLNELRHGRTSLAGAQAGVARFREGAGRHGGWPPRNLFDHLTADFLGQRGHSDPGVRRFKRAPGVGACEGVRPRSSVVPESVLNHGTGSRGTSAACRSAESSIASSSPWELWS
jgi:enoyl-CoA hydratase